MDDLAVFVGITMVMLVVPGPDFVLVTRNALAGSRRRAYSTVVGICAGLTFLAVATAGGVAALVAANEAMLTILRVAGGVYLVLLGALLWRSAWRRPSVRTYFRKRRSRLAHVRSWHLARPMGFSGVCRCGDTPHPGAFARTVARTLSTWCIGIHDVAVPTARHRLRFPHPHRSHIILKEPLTEPSPTGRAGSPVVQGFLNNVLNPKALVFYLTFMPQFVVRGVPVFVQTLGMGLVVVLCAAVWWTVYVTALGYLGTAMRRDPVRAVVDAVSGSALAALGVVFVLS